MSATNDLIENRIKYVENLFGVSGMVIFILFIINLTNVQPLLIPNRELIGEGVMLKICRRKPKERHFFLFNDILIYGNIIIYKRKVCQIINFQNTIIKIQLISQHIFELESLTVCEVDGNESGNIICKTVIN